MLDEDVRDDSLKVSLYLWPYQSHDTVLPKVFLGVWSPIEQASGYETMKVTSSPLHVKRKFLIFHYIKELDFTGVCGLFPQPLLIKKQ